MEWPGPLHLTAVTYLDEADVAVQHGICGLHSGPPDAFDPPAACERLELGSVHALRHDAISAGKSLR